MPKIPLTQGQTAIVCECHAHLVQSFRWHATWVRSTQSYYAKRSLTRLFGKRNIFMHAVINGTPTGMETDHINGNTLDNRCSNLRTATTQNNKMNQSMPRHNTSGFKGVSWKKSAKKWRAEIALDRKTYHLGYFDNVEDAARAYDASARELHGEFAHTNFEK